MNSMHKLFSLWCILCDIVHTKMDPVWDVVRCVVVGLVLFCEHLYWREREKITECIMTCLWIFKHQILQRPLVVTFNKCLKISTSKLSNINLTLKWSYLSDDNVGKCGVLVLIMVMVRTWHQIPHKNLQEHIPHITIHQDSVHPKGHPESIMDPYRATQDRNISTCIDQCRTKTTKEPKRHNKNNKKIKISHWIFQSRN